jgi:hypothetical protein
MSQTRRLAAILAADVAGFSRLIEAEGGRHARTPGRSDEADAVLASAETGCQSSLPSVLGSDRLNNV